MAVTDSSSVSVLLDMTYRATQCRQVCPSHENAEDSYSVGYFAH
ncbi:Uncharacterised protein [Bordetella pertussis]|nr:Uncharacterised protein [Bordetella pertussis]